MGKRVVKANCSQTDYFQYKVTLVVSHHTFQELIAYWKFHRDGPQR